MDRAPKGIWIPILLWLDPGVPKRMKDIAIEIESLDNGVGCFAGADHFARLFGMNKDSVNNLLSKMKKEGIIYTVKFDGKTAFRKLTKEFKMTYWLPDETIPEVRAKMGQLSSKCYSSSNKNVRALYKSRNINEKYTLVSSSGNPSEETENLVPKIDSKTSPKPPSKTPPKVPAAPPSSELISEAKSDGQDYWGRMAIWMWTEIRKERESRGMLIGKTLSKAKLPDWSRELRLTHESDGYEKQIMIDVVRFAIADDFWFSNCQSPAGLRRNFDQIYQKWHSNKPQEQGKTNYAIKKSGDYDDI